jgi:methionyl-tRNA formyltransferase
VRVVFAGTPEVAVPSLRALVSSPHEVVAVVTRPDAPAGRGRRVSRSEVALAADEHDITVLQPEHPKDPEFLDQLTQLAPDCVPVVAYGALVPQKALQIPRFGWVNLHFSLLPAWRGAAPVQHALLAGDTVTGATTFQLDRGMDTGPVFGVLTEAIRPRDTTGDLLTRLADSGAELLRATLDGLELGRITPVPQAQEDVSYAPKLNPEDFRIDWQQPAMRVDRLARAAAPAPGAWTTFRDQRLKVAPVLPVTDYPGTLPPAEVLVHERTVLVGTWTDPVQLISVQPPGKRMMPAVDWINGVRPAPGDTFL